MKLETWIHTALHIGCVALLVLQGHRILQLQTNWMEDREYLRELVVREASSAAKERAPTNGSTVQNCTLLEKALTCRLIHPGP
jgi:hypothetical protein